MFLTKKALLKIKLWCIAYAFVGVVGVALGILLKMTADKSILLVLGILCLVMAPLLYWCGRRAEGTEKLVNAGKKLVHSELRPAEFIEQYLTARNHPDNVVSKPSFDVLLMVVNAYDAMGESEHALEVIEEMLLILPDKKKTMAYLLKTDILLDMGRTEEAEALLSMVHNKKMSFQDRAFADAIYKSDRAKAIGDYATVENYLKQSLLTTFPKPTNLALLFMHYNLAEVYMKTGRPNEAKPHYEYCAANGGQTAVQKSSEEQLKTPALS